MRNLILSIVTALLLSVSVQAATINGIDVPDTLTVGEQELMLNGTGLRKKGPFKVYLAALYTSTNTTELDALLAQEGAKRVELHMLRTVGKAKMVGAIVDGFKANTGDMASIQIRVDEFISYMEKAKKGDTIQFDFIPDSGTNIVINDTAKGTIVGKDFFDALLKVWVGEKPADKRLKKGLMGG